MGFFKKLSSVLGTDSKSDEPSALDKIRELKRQMGMDDECPAQNRDQKTQESKQKTEVEKRREQFEQSRQERVKDMQERRQKIEEDMKRAKEDAKRRLEESRRKFEDRLRKAKEKFESDDEEVEEDEDLEEEVDIDEFDFEENEDIDEVEENEDEEEEDEEEVENRQKPIFVIRLKRFEAPLTPLDVAEHKGDFESTGSTCVLMRDKEEDPDQAHCFFGDPAYGLMNKAIAALWSWNDGEEEPIEPVVDYLVEAKCYNDSVHPDTIDDVAYYIVNEFGKQSWDITGEFPYSDSLIRVINEVDGGKYRYDFVAYKGYSGINDDDEGWVDKMISYHHIDL